MKRFDSQKALFKMGAVSQAQAAILAMDIAVAYASIAILEAKVDDGEAMTQEEAAVHRACIQVVEKATAELCGLAANYAPGFRHGLPMVPKGIGRVCRSCGCSDGDPCTNELDDRLAGCRWVKPDLCSACQDRGFADGSETIPPEATIN